MITMRLHWDVFVAAKITDMNKARALQKEFNYEIISIKGAWYMRDKYLVIDTKYPGSILASNDTIVFQTSEGSVQTKFDAKRLGNFVQLVSANQMELTYWETFISGTCTPRYRIVSTDII